MATQGETPRIFRDKVGKGELDSTPIVVPSGATSETGTDDHPGPFVAAAFHPSSQQFYGLMPRRNTPNKPKERAGKVLIDDKRLDDMHNEERKYKPRAKVIHRNFAKKK